MRQLAKSRPPAKLAGEAYHLYEKFRPSVPAGTLDLAAIRKLARLSAPPRAIRDSQIAKA